jgi:hypothetical protein
MARSTSEMAVCGYQLGATYMVTIRLALCRKWRSKPSGNHEQVIRRLVAHATLSVIRSAKCIRSPEALKVVPMAAETSGDSTV